VRAAAIVIVAGCAGCAGVLLLVGAVAVALLHH
jgi:hypothetical protein